MPLSDTDKLPNVLRWIAKTGLDVGDETPNARILVTSAVPGEGKTLIAQLMTTQLRSEGFNCRILHADDDAATQDSMIHTLETAPNSPTVTFCVAPPVYRRDKDIDPVTLCHHVDLILFVVLARGTNRTDVKRAAMTLSQTGEPVYVIMNNRQNRFYKPDDRLYI